MSANENQEKENTTNRSRVEAAEASRRMDGVRAMASRVEGLTFDRVLPELKMGIRVARAGWNGKGQFLQVQLPDIDSKMTAPYIFISTTQGDLVPWVASQTDLLAGDWCLVFEKKVLVYGEGGETLAAGDSGVLRAYAPGLGKAPRPLRPGSL